MTAFSPTGTLDPVQAYDRLATFAQRYGRLPLRLAMHAAVPQGFRLDLLHLLKLNFVPEAANDTTVEADLILAGICHDLGDGYFEFDPEVRRLLLDSLVDTYSGESPPRVRRVANFLLSYVEQLNLNPYDPKKRLRRDYLEIQRWVALGFLNPEQAAYQLAAALDQAEAAEEVTVRVRLGGLASVLSTPLVQHDRLLTYAVGLQALETGQYEQAQALLAGLGEQEISVGDIRLRSPATILQEWQRQREPASLQVVLKTKLRPQTITLEKKLATGGEGEIWLVQNQPNLIAKIFRTPTPALERKLIFMAQHPPRDSTMINFNYPSIAWPTDLLYNNGKFTGYLMPRVTDSVEIIEVYYPVHRKKYPQFTWQALVHAAFNLAAAVHTLHQYDYVIGDINPKNVFVSLPDNYATIVTVIDTDSFQVTDNDGSRYLCRVATPLFTPPELKNPEIDYRAPTQDYFGLAVMIFYLLMEGHHPFSGQLFDQNHTVERIEIYLLKSGVFPYESNKTAGPSPYAPSYNILPPYIQALFHRCFVEGLTKPAERPTPKEWFDALKQLEAATTTCVKNPNHNYSNHLEYCPWCD